MSLTVRICGISLTFPKKCFSDKIIWIFKRILFITFRKYQDQYQEEHLSSDHIIRKYLV